MKNQKFFSQFTALINKIFYYFASFLLFLIIFNVFFAVISRYIFNDSIVWAEQLARYLFVWMIFIGAALAVGTDDHVGLDIMKESVGSRLKYYIETLIIILSIVFVIFLLISGVNLAIFGQRSKAMLVNIPMSYIYAAVPIASLIMILNFIDRLSRTRREPVERQ